VTNETRRPVAGATVELVPDLPRYLLPEQLDSLSRASSGGDGTFSIDISDTQPVVLIASAPGFRRTKFPISGYSTGNRRIGIILGKGETISGTVKDENGKPLPGVKLGPLVPSIDTEISVARRHVPQWTKSASDGTFSFDGIMPRMESQFLARQTGYEIANTVVRPGKRDVDIRLKKGGSAVAGRIHSRNRGGEAFAGTPIRLNGNGFDLVLTADAHGGFAVTGMPPGNFSIEALIDSGRHARIAIVEFPRDAGKTVSLEVSDGFFVEGITLDAETSAPVGGVGIRSEDASTTSSAAGFFRLGPLDQPGRPLIDVVEAGGFRAAAPPPDSMVRNGGSDGFADITGETVWVSRRRMLEVQIPNISGTSLPLTLYLLPERGVARRTPATTSPLTIPVFVPGTCYAYAMDTGGTASDLTTVTIGQHDITGVRLPLDRAARLTGQVGSAADPATTRGRNFTARLYAGPDETSCVLLSESPCNQKGAFTFPVLPAGCYRVEVSGNSGNIRKEAWVLLGAGSREYLQFNLPAGKLLSGTVRSEDGEAIAGVNVRYYLRGETGGTFAGSVDTNDNGTFRAEELDSASVDLLEIDYPGFASFEQRGISLPAENLDITLRRPGGVLVKVDASPASSWQLHLVKIDRWGAGTYGDQLVGRVAIEKAATGGNEEELMPPAEGTFRVVAIGAGNTVGVSKAFEWKPSAPVAVYLTISPGAGGKLLGSLDGAPPDAVEIVATNMTLPDGKCETEYHATANNREFGFAGLPPGDYLVIATHERFSANATNIVVSAGEATRITLGVASLAAVSGVVTLDSKPVAGAEIELVSQTDPETPARQARTGEDGVFAFDNISADGYVVRARGGEKELSAQRTITVERNSSPAPLAIDLSPPKRISFRLPASMSASGDAPILLLSRESGEMIRAERSNGALEANIAPGVYSVSRGDDPLGTIEIGADGSVRTVE
jgi:hypothetical protein